MPKSSSAKPQPSSSSSRPKRDACSRFAIAAVSVTSKISRRGSTPEDSISPRIAVSISGSPIDLPERLISRLSSGRSRCACIASIALATTQRSSSWIRP